MFTKIINWVIYSSKDPSRYSLTIKGSAGWVAASIVSLLAVMFQEEVNTGDVNSIITMLGDIVGSGLQLVSQAVEWVALVLALYGAIRKIYLTIFPKTIV